MSEVINLSSSKSKMLIPIDSDNGYLVHEHVLRLYASPDQNIQSLGDGTAGSHNIFLKHLVRDYIRIYKHLESLGEL